ncbi:CbtA family protein [Kineosporia mesophila]|uniref:CbtA family protein n=1 Tax=Kineosporia mesophila TaxID=566012 RepID=A0ABP7ACI4_9ACTN|nr:CbtA family protein [Kineosporia mesophila]MCD5351262.1 CbtA family protein [Kineosporia mesophila]
MRTLLIRGLLAGLLAGLAAFGVAYLVGEPSLRTAIAYEETGTAADHHHDEAATSEHAHGEEAEVSRTVQSTWGLLTGTLAIGLAVGGIVALALALAIGRIGPLGERGTAALVVGIGFVAVVLVPFLTYPPNPPAVGDPDTIGTRTAAYFGLLLASLVAVGVAGSVARSLGGRTDAWGRAGAAALTYVVLMLAVAAVLPSYDELGDFPASTLWSFRLGSLATLTTLWGVVGLTLVASLARIRTTPARAGAGSPA